MYQSKNINVLIAKLGNLSAWKRTGIVDYITEDELYINYTQDTMPRCVCGKVIQYHHEIKNFETGETCIVGSECINNFRSLPGTRRASELAQYAKEDKLNQCGA